MFDGVTAGRAIIFVSALGGVAIFGALWLTYAAHSFIVVLIDSSTGADEVHWPDEAVGDWWWKPIFCAALLLFWATVAFVLAAPLMLAGQLAFAIGGAILLWLGYPVSFLCALDARNEFAVLHVPLLTRLPRHLGALAFVVLITLPLSAGAVASVLAVLLHSIAWLPLAMLVVPAALLHYGRAWGRLSWLLLNAKKRKGIAREQAPDVLPVSVQDPWALPPEPEIPEFDVEVEPVDFPEPLRDPDDWDADPTPYALASAERGPPEGGASSDPDAERPVGKDDDGEARTASFSLVGYYDEYRKKEAQRQARAEGTTVPEKRRRGRPTFKVALGDGALPFLIYLPTLRAWLNLALLTMGFLFFLWVAVNTIPRG